MKRTTYFSGAHYKYNVGAVVCLMVILFSAYGCTSFRDARTVVARADSLDVQGQLLGDTTILQEAISTLDSPFGRTFCRTDLAKANYYLGRIYDDSLDCICQAARYYIACDRLRANDHLHRARANTCMAYICMRQRADEIALVYCRRASELLANTEYDWFYAHSLLNMCSSFLELNYVPQADSVWHLASQFSLDSAYAGRVMGLRGSCLYAQGQCDSALLCFQCAMEYPVYEGQRCFYNTQRMLIHCDLQNIDSALIYAQYVAEHSDTPAYLAEAYATLIHFARLRNDADALAKYTYLNEDNNRILRLSEGHYAVAISMLQDYVHQPYPFLPWQIATVSLAVFILVFIIAVAITHRKQKIWVEQKDQIIEEKNELLKRQQQAHRQQLDNLTRTQAEAQNISVHRMSEFLIAVNNLHNQYPKPAKEWGTDYQAFRRDTATPFDLLIKQLQQRSLAEKEIQYCVYAILYKELPATEIAAYLFYSKSGIRTFKQRIAYKLGTSATSLYDTLIDLALA